VVLGYGELSRHRLVSSGAVEVIASFGGSPQSGKADVERTTVNDGLTGAMGGRRDLLPVSDEIR
jgi:hypothetical protein